MALKLWHFKLMIHKRKSQMHIKKDCLHETVSVTVGPGTYAAQQEQGIIPMERVKLSQVTDWRWQKCPIVIETGRASENLMVIPDTSTVPSQKMISLSSLD